MKDAVAGEERVSRLKEELGRYYTRYYRDTLGLPDWRDRVTGRLAGAADQPAGDEFWVRQLKNIERAVGPLEGHRILNVGCGTGEIVVAAEQIGAPTWGIDIEEQAVAICRLRRALWTRERDAVAAAEGLPFRDGMFDCVLCLSALEHVSDVQKSLSEMVRVLSPGGVLFVYAPSGWAWYESHYKIFWVPWLSRRLARLYLWLRGRPTKFVDTLNALSVGRCRRWLEEAGARVEEVPPEDGARGGLVQLWYRCLRVRPEIALVARKPAA